MTFPTNRKPTMQRPVAPEGFSHVVTITYQNKPLLVTTDYYMKDGIRMPVDAPRAERIAERAGPGWQLPTKDQVDAIWAQAEIRLTPQPIPWNDANVTLPVFTEHNRMINAQLHAMGVPYNPGMLVAGHKKDIVRGRRNGRVAIYGWHQIDGRPIQPLSNVHGAGYKDYSHGVRLVKGET